MIFSGDDTRGGERGVSPTTFDWRRLSGFAFHWHYGIADEEQFVALCGRMIASDVDVVVGVRPAHDERCSDCERLRIDRVRIERGLTELRHAGTSADYASAHEFDTSDAGGER